MNLVSALPTLLSLAPKAGLHRAVLGCAHRPRWHACEGMEEQPSLDWSVCPLDLLGHPLVQRVLDLDRLARVAPLSGWPDRYAAWAVNGLLLLRQQRGE